jgi:hypothetical protein
VSIRFGHTYGIIFLGLGRHQGESSRVSWHGHHHEGSSGRYGYPRRYLRQALGSRSRKTSFHPIQRTSRCYTPSSSVGVAAAACLPLSAAPSSDVPRRRMLERLSAGAAPRRRRLWTQDNLISGEEKREREGAAPIWWGAMRSGTLTAASGCVRYRAARHFVASSRVSRLLERVFPQVPGPFPLRQRRPCPQDRRCPGRPGLAVSWLSADWERIGKLESEGDSHKGTGEVASEGEKREVRASRPQSVNQPQDHHPRLSHPFRLTYTS